MNELNFGDGFHLTPDVMTFLVNACQSPSASLYKDMSDCIVYGCELSDSTYADGAVVYNGEILPVKGGAVAYGKAKLVQDPIENVYKDGQPHKVLFDRYFEVTSDTKDGDEIIYLSYLPRLNFNYIQQRTSFQSVPLTSKLNTGVTALTDENIYKRFGYSSDAYCAPYAMIGGDIVLLNGGITIDSSSPETLFNIGSVGNTRPVYFNAPAIYVIGGAVQTGGSMCALRLEVGGNVVLKHMLDTRNVYPTHIIFPSIVVNLQS